MQKCDKKSTTCITKKSSVTKEVKTIQLTEPIDAQILKLHSM